MFSLLTLLASLHRAQAQTSHYWQVTYAGSGTYNYATRDVPTTGQSTPQSPVPWTNNGGGGGGSTNINGDSEGTVTATLKWIPAAGQTLTSDPPPSPVRIIEYGSATETPLWSSNGTYPGPAGSADDGLRDPEVVCGNGYVSTGMSQGATMS